MMLERPVHFQLAPFYILLLCPCAKYLRLMSCVIFSSLGYKAMALWVFLCFSFSLAFLWLLMKLPCFHMLIDLHVFFVMKYLAIFWVCYSDCINSLRFLVYYYEVLNISLYTWSLYFLNMFLYLLFFMVPLINRCFC